MDLDLVGKVWLERASRHWIIACDADVMARLKRVFPRVPEKANGEAPLADTPINAKELRWFLLGFPMEISDADRAYLEQRAAEEVTRQRAMKLVLTGQHTPTKFDVALKPWDFQYQPAELCFASGGVLVADEVGLGKEAPLTSRVLAPTGWRLMGDLAVGDEVVDPDGGVGRVEGIYPQGVKDVYRVVAEDGGAAECGEEHLWLAHRPGDGWRVRPLRELAGAVWAVPTLGAMSTPRPIARVERPARREPMQCIRVSTKRHLYVTDDYLVTHNTLEGALLLSDPRAQPGLVVCPAHLVSHWETKLAEYLPRARVHVLKKGRPYPLPNPFPDILVCSIPKLAGWAVTLAPRVRSVVYDEIHNFCHEFSDPQQTERVKKYAAALHLRDHVPYRMGLSGSVISNYGGEIRTVMNVLLPEPLGTKKEFGLEHCGGYGGEKATVKNPDALSALMVNRGLMTNRTRKQVGRDLPPLKSFVQPIEVDMNPLNRVRYDTIEHAKTLLRRGVTPEEKLYAAKEIDWKLREATGVAKAPFVAAFVRMLAGREKVMLFGYHHAFWRIIGAALADLKPVLYTGKETPHQKQSSVDAFLHGDAQVFCMSQRAGEGVDGLQHVCSRIVIGELDWSWTRMFKQNVGRLLREGQKFSVFVDTLVADAGSDPVIADALNIKRAQFEGLIQPGEERAPLEVQTDPGHVKDLARAWLKANDPRALAAIDREIAEAERTKEDEKAARKAARAAKKGGQAPETAAAPELAEASAPVLDPLPSGDGKAPVQAPAGEPPAPPVDVDCGDGEEALAGPAPALDPPPQNVDCNDGDRDIATSSRGTSSTATSSPRTSSSGLALPRRPQRRGRRHLLKPIPPASA